MKKMKKLSILSILITVYCFSNAIAQNVSFSPSIHKIKGLENSLDKSPEIYKKSTVSKHYDSLLTTYILKDSTNLISNIMSSSGDTSTGKIRSMFRAKVSAMVKLDTTYNDTTIDNYKDDLLKETKQAIDSITALTIGYIKSASGDVKGVSNDSLARYISSQLENRRNGIKNIEQRYSMVYQAYESAIQPPRNTLFFPSLNAPESINFYLEKDTMSNKFFSNNSLIYNGSQQKMSYGNETYSDFFGPIRFGIGFLISSTSNGKDTNQNKSDAIQKITATGGNIYTSFSFPFLSYTDIPFMSIKSSIYTNIGVDIPKDSVSASSYGLISSTGINVNVYSQGFLRILQVFYTGKVFYVLGNNNFQQRLGNNDFWLMQNSFGLAVKDNFRIRLDVYNGFGAQVTDFVRSSFPVTVSFDLINPF
jgi:hypothetical protein